MLAPEIWMGCSSRMAQVSRVEHLLMERATLLGKDENSIIESQLPGREARMAVGSEGRPGFAG